MIEKICNILSTITFIALLALALLLLVPNLIGYKSFAVISGSMEPKIPVGSIVYTKDTSFDELEKGDVISYELSKETMVTHRIESVNTEDRTLITKGDANNTADSNPVHEKQLVGKVALSIPLLGYISIYVKTPLGIAGACAIIFLLILLNFLPELFKKEGQKEQKKKS